MGAGLLQELLSISVNKHGLPLTFGKYKQSLSVPRLSWFSLENDAWLPAGPSWQLVSLAGSNTSRRMWLGTLVLGRMARLLGPEEASLVLGSL